MSIVSYKNIATRLSIISAVSPKWQITDKKSASAKCVVYYNTPPLFNAPLKKSVLTTCTAQFIRAKCFLLFYLKWKCSMSNPCQLRRNHIYHDLVRIVYLMLSQLHDRRSSDSSISSWWSLKREILLPPRCACLPHVITVDFIAQIISDPFATQLCYVKSFIPKSALLLLLLNLRNKSR